MQWKAFNVGWSSVWKTKHLQQRKKLGILHTKKEKLFKFAVDSGKKITEIANAQV